MKLQIEKRSTEKKSELRKIRQAGNIPATIYIKGKDSEAITLKGGAFTALLRGVLPGRLPTAQFTLVDDKGKEHRVIVKEIQYNVTTYQVIHLDFEELNDKVQVNIKVPIECIGMGESPGIKLGGSLRQVIRHLKVRCYPKDIPAFLQVDVKDMNLNQVKRLGELGIPQTVRPLVNLNEVAVAIVKR